MKNDLGSIDYDAKAIEKKWHDIWKKKSYFKTKENKNIPKYYCLDMFPFPSGSGIHVGHWKGYVFSDVYARMKLLQGYNVLHPMGWDAFGLPAENDAIKNGIHPKINTNKNIENFKRQLDCIGAIYDWDKELNTTDPKFYMWTQWIFLKMFNAGLAYEDTIAINWCPSCLTGLANEEVVDGGCERCGTPVEQKKIRQWILRITNYAEKLLKDLDELEWPEQVKLMQKNWIGKSSGLLFTAPVKGMDIKIQTFSSHFESFKADTFVVIAPDHPLLNKLIEDVENRDRILAFSNKIIQKRIERGFEEEKEPEGIFTEKYIIDPVSGDDLPIWVASFAIATYGTGMIKCSAHDIRDFWFAKKYNIPLKAVLYPPNNPELSKKVKSFEECYTNTTDGILLEPDEFHGKSSGDVRNDIINYCVENGYAKEKINYKLRDWVFSRQRYWGEPIPLIHCKKCGVVPVPENELPVLLPDVERYEPTGTGESPLATIDEWVNRQCPQCNEPAKRETNTMPQWAGSCWYFLRYTTTHLNNKPFDQNEIRYWMPVDLYVGGIEHAILHLLYARFYVKVLYDLGYLQFNEPFKKLFNQGMVCMKSPITGRVEKMSKSKGNVVNPDEIVDKYGSDTLRMYMLFMGPPKLDTEWQMKSIKGVKNFLNRLWDVLTNSRNIVETTKELDEQSLKRFHRFLKDYKERVDLYKVNTAVSAAMEYLNDFLEKNLKLSKELLEKLLSALSIMIPHFASELLEKLLGKSLLDCTWPTFDDGLAALDEIEIAIQVNGKLRGTLLIQRDVDQETVQLEAKKNVSKWLEGKTPVKIIFVPNRLINFVVK